MYVNEPDYAAIHHRVVREPGPDVTEEYERPASQVRTKLPTHVPYLIVGAGTAALHAARTIRACDATAKVSFFFVYIHSYLIAVPCKLWFPFS